MYHSRVPQWAGLGAAPSLRLFNEPLVVPHNELGFELTHCINRHTDHDKQRRCAQTDLYTCNLLGNEWQHRDKPQEQRTHQCDAVDHAHEIFLGALARPDARNKPIVALERLRDILLVKDNHGVKVGEPDD